jgi:hypothetical protein
LGAYFKEDLKMGELLGLFIWLKGRLEEPSTFGSVAAVMAAFNVHLDPGMIQDWITTLSLIFGAMGFFISEKGPKTKI